MFDDILTTCSVIGPSPVRHRSVNGPSTVDDMVHVMLRQRSTTWSTTCSVTGRRHAPSPVDDMVHVIDWEHQLAHFLFHFTLQYLHAGLTQITLGAVIWGVILGTLF